MLNAPPRLLLVHAHPDDESLTTGGTIARYAANGVQVTLVTCTLGEEGEIIPEQLGLLAANEADQLGGYRFGELRAACAALGITDHRYLGGVGRWRDSGMIDTPSNAHPRALVRGVIGDQIAALSEVLAEVRPDVVVTYGPDGGYGHPDHIRAHQITMAACADVPYIQRIFYAVAGRSAISDGIARLSELDDLPFTVPAHGELPTVDDSDITTVVPIGEYLPAKLLALRAHATQVSVWQGSCYSLSNGIAQPTVDSEFYVLAKGNADGAATDLFGGLDLATPAGRPSIPGGRR
jgi:N-acetyl-1-D-myo-inositol-2-amino-2-deoxy-alpha-D-glucopyranoside deacetylase